MKNLHRNEAKLIFSCSPHVYVNSSNIKNIKNDHTSVTVGDNIQADLKPGSVQLHRGDGEAVEAGEAVGAGDEKTLRRS